MHSKNSNSPPPSERMDVLDQRLFAGLTELFVRDGIAGWVRFREALDLGIQAHAMATKKGKR